jgi:outer membrane murein-binding lipoprotein Lpp
MSEPVASTGWTTGENTVQDVDGQHGNGPAEGSPWQRPQGDPGMVSWGAVAPVAALPPAAPAPVTWTASTPPRSRRTALLVTALVLGALAVGGLGGAVGGVRAADDQDRVDALSGQVGELEVQVADLEDDLDTTREQAADDVASARAEARAEVDAENAGTVAELDARAADLTNREGAVAAREDAVTVLEQQAADLSIPGSGVHLVGEEIAPGTYRASSPEDCYWERLSGLSGEFGDIIANGIGAGDSTVTIRPGDMAFASERCGTWARIG